MIFTSAVMSPINKTWKKTAKTLGLEYRGGFLKVGTIEGEMDGYSVDVTGDDKTKVRIDSRSRIPLDLDVGREGVLNSLRRSGRDDAIVTGDVSFDDRVSVFGSEISALTVLDKSTRGLLRKLVTYFNAKVEAGTVQIETKKTVSEAARLETLVTDALELAKRLSLHKDLRAETMYHNAVHDPVPRMRHQNLLNLIECFPDGSEAKEAVESAITDVDP